MTDHPGRLARRPLAQPFSHASSGTDEPLVERLLPAERLDPFAVPAAPVPAARPTGGRRRPLGEGGLSYVTVPAGD